MIRYEPRKDGTPGIAASIEMPDGCRMYMLGADALEAVEFLVEALRIHTAQGDASLARSEEERGRLRDILQDIIDCGIGYTGVDIGRGGDDCRYCEEKTELARAALTTPTAPEGSETKA